MEMKRYYIHTALYETDVFEYPDDKTAWNDLRKALPHKFGTLYREEPVTVKINNAEEYIRTYNAKCPKYDNSKPFDFTYFRPVMFGITDDEYNPSTKEEHARTMEMYDNNEDNHALAMMLRDSLPYGLKCLVTIGDLTVVETLDAVRIDEKHNPAIGHRYFHTTGEDGVGTWSGFGIRPYLRGKDTLTDEEREELYRNNDGDASHEWFAKKHIDWCNLIGKGLALPAPEGMYDEADSKCADWRYFPKDRFSSYEEYARYLKCEGLAVDAPEGKCND